MPKSNVVMLEDECSGNVPRKRKRTKKEKPVRIIRDKFLDEVKPPISAMNQVQKDFLRALKEYDVVVFNAPAGCVDMDTEYFNGKSWVKISEYAGGEVLQYKDNGDAIMVKPKAYIKIPCDTFFKIESQCLDMVLSEDHDVVYFNPHTKWANKPLKISAGDMVERHKKNKYGFAGRIKTVFNYSGKGIDFTEGELRLQVAVMADGRIVKEGKNNYTQMRFTKKRKYARLKSMCEKFNIPYKDNGKSLCAKYANGIEYEIIVWPKRSDKNFTSYYYDCTNEQFKIICDEVFHWDGSFPKEGGKNVSPRYFSKHKSDVDFIQFAHAAIGIRCSISADVRDDKDTTYRLHRNANKRFLALTGGEFGGKMKQEIIKESSKDGYKYCFTVPSGMLVLRRNNKIFVTGNCGKSLLTMSEVCDWLKKGEIDSVTITRPAIPMGRSIGLLPGTLQEKYQEFLIPLLSVIWDRYGKGWYDTNISNGTLKLLPPEYARGMSISGVMILDEAQGFHPEELYTMLTRLEDGGKLILIGDPNQSDIKGENGIDWLCRFVDHHRELNNFVKIIRASSDDIVRGGFCKALVKAKEKEGLQIESK